MSKKSTSWRVRTGKWATYLCGFACVIIIVNVFANVNTTHPIPSSKNPNRNKNTSGIQRYVYNSNTSKRITLNFTNIKTRVLLQLFSQFTGLNFIVSNKVQGTMSVHLKNIPWPHAFSAILKSQGLAQRRIGNAIIIAPLTDIQKEEIDELERQQNLDKLRAQKQIQALESENKIKSLQPLFNKIIHLKYASAEEIAEMLTKEGSLLTSRGSLGVDKRSNSIWVRDTRDHVNTVAKLIYQLDFPEKQVAIDTRIVSIRRPYERQLGIRWGVTSKVNRLSGTLAGANQLLSVPAKDITPFTDRLNFNIPATSLANSLVPPASIGIALAKIGDFNIDAELSALEGEGKLTTISKPRLITSNLQPAYIKTGEEIPYEEATSSGATSIAFKEANLSLEVTPRITCDNQILLKIKVANNRRGNIVPLSQGGSAIPIITEEEESTILVENKQTVVLGGVFKQEKEKVITRIPFLGRIPILGYLFKHTKIVNNRDELIIFLTPCIIHHPSELNGE